MKELKMMSLFAIFLLILHVNHGFGDQAIKDTSGRDFFIGILKPHLPEQIVMLLNSKHAAHVTIQSPFMGINTTLLCNKRLEYHLSKAFINTQPLEIERKGIRITSDADISVTVITYPSVSHEGFLVLPRHMLGTRYVIASYPRPDGNSYSYSEFLIVGTEPNTTVELSNGRGLMQELDTFLYQNNWDLSGMVITSNKPVAIFSGHEAVDVPSNCSAPGQFIVEQLLPTSLFNLEYIVPAIYPKNSYVVRVFSSFNHTAVSYTIGNDHFANNLATAGEHVEFTQTDVPTSVIATKPVQVVLYSPCYGWHGQNFGNTFMTVVPSTTQFVNEYEFNVPSALDRLQHHLVITCATDAVDGVKLNGQPLPRKQRVYTISHQATTYTVAVLNLTLGNFSLTHTSGRTFGALLYGYGTINLNVGSYGFSLGMAASAPDIDCGKLPSPPHGHVDMSNGTSLGSQAFYSCDSGYEFLEEPRRTCNEYWSWGSDTQPLCFPKNCGLLAKPANGYVSQTFGSTYNTSAVYSCVRGYDLQGDAKRTCQATGFWNGTEPSCVPKDCGSLVIPAHATVQYSSSTTFGSKATYTCDIGYFIQGDMERTCLNTGLWNGIQPTCVEIVCGFLLRSPQNGTVHYYSGSHYGSRAIYSCDSGYELQGNAERTCQESGFWNGTDPTCVQRDANRRVTCLDCHNISDVSQCRTVKHCQTGQVCFVEQMDNIAGEVKYNAGCMFSNMCTFQSQGADHCVHCCNTDLCNVKGCGNAGFGSLAYRGPLCYNCSAVGNIDECKSIALCATDEVCMIEQLKNSGPDHRLTAKCFGHQCLAVPYEGVQQSSSDQFCCPGDLCNTRPDAQTGTGVGAAIIG